MLSAEFRYALSAVLSAVALLAVSRGTPVDAAMPTIRQMLGISAGASQVRLHRALRLLRTALSEGEQP